jgi:hypothetical protein
LAYEKNKPYTTCLDCGIQTFFRRKVAIKRLKEIVSSKILTAGNGSKTELAILLFNRIQQLRAQKSNSPKSKDLLFMILIWKTGAERSLGIGSGEITIGKSR